VAVVKIASAAIGALLIAGAAHAGEVIDVAVRDGVTESVLLVNPGVSQPKAIVISFVGGKGAINLARRVRNGGIHFGRAANFLVRVRSDVASSDIVDAIVDAPSDLLPGGMTDDFRAGATHAADIGKVIDELQKRYAGAPVYLLGTSRGTISVANLSVRLGPRVKGAILTSTVTRADRVGPALSRFNFSDIKVPVLFVHHHDDGCFSSPYEGARKAAGDSPFVTVHGGSPPESDPCQPLAAHGFFGREPPVVEVIHNFILGREYAREIARVRPVERRPSSTALSSTPLLRSLPGQSSRPADYGSSPYAKIDSRIDGCRSTAWTQVVGDSRT